MISTEVKDCMSLVGSSGASNTVTKADNEFTNIPGLTSEPGKFLHDWHLQLAPHVAPPCRDVN